MENIIPYLQEAFSFIMQSIDWVYALMFILTSWYISRILMDSNIFTNIKVNIKKRYIVLGIGFVLAIVFGIMFKVNGGFIWYHSLTNYGFSLFLSFIMTMVLNEFFGFDAILDKLFGTKINK